MASKKESIEFEKKYTYNRENDTYILDIKHKVKPLVINGYKLRAIRRAISNAISPSETAATICTKYRLLPEDFESIKKAFDLTRDCHPLTDEEVESQSEEQSVAQLLYEKRAAISQSFEKEEWKETQKAAKSWQDFQYGLVDPISTVIDSWKPCKIKVKTPTAKSRSGKILCISLSDLHWGNKANERYMFNGKGGWDSDKTSAAVEAYLQSLMKTISERNYNFDEVAVFFMGDILHSVSGKTCRGTELKYDIVREEQFEYALDSLSKFLFSIVEAFPSVKVFTTIGNHNPEGEIGLYRALDKLFDSVDSIEFTHLTSRPATFVLGSTLFLMEHGQDSGERAYVPLAEGKLVSHVQSLLLQKPELLTPNIKSKIFIMGDKHRFRHIEFDNFEFIMFGTIQLSDEHASVNNWCNRARQSCLVLDENGLSEILHFYTDSLLNISQN